MDAEMTVAATPARRGRNWWKLAFFVLLVAFELAREFAVLSAAEGAQPNSNGTVFEYNGYVKAQGSWTRIDGGGAMAPGTVTIECRPEEGRCLEASVMISERYVYAPDLDYFDATFSPQAVAYENENPVCARYAVRIDLRLKKVFAVRERKEDAKEPQCALLEKGRIEMQLGKGFDPERDPLEGHFVPLIQILAAIL